VRVPLCLRQGEVVLSLWAAIIVNVVSLVLLLLVRAGTALAFSMFRYRYSSDPVGRLRCVLCRCCLVTSRARAHSRGGSYAANGVDATQAGRLGSASAATASEATALMADTSDTPDEFEGLVCGCQCAAATFCERL
jgi:hypothetical protein